MSNKYVDTTAIIQVIGNVYNNLELLDMTEEYTITDYDFPNEFHRVVFGVLYKIHELGAKVVTLNDINDFLNSRPKSRGIFKANKGEEWLLKASEACQELSFNYYYGRLKKMTFLRELSKHGIDMSEYYDPDNILDAQKKQIQEDWLDNMSLMDIAATVDEKIEKLRTDFVDTTEQECSQAGKDLDELLEDLKAHPEVGVPLYGPLINTVCRGARLKKFYLRSAATGTGKSRTMAADACYIACNEYYDENFGWMKLYTQQPVLFITTEQELSEVQTMMLAFISHVNEEHILNWEFAEGEEERVYKAKKILKDAPLYIQELPDFSLDDIENKIKKGIRLYGVRYVCLDYIHTSLKILEEITRKSGGVKLREDNILFMLSIRLKDLCNKYNIFILSATQLNGNYVSSETPDQNLLRGAKSMADKIDLGLILLSTNDDDLVALEQILVKGGFDKPTLKISVYKNRRGRYKGVYLWCRSDLGTCRVQPMFCTTWNYEMVPIDNIQIQVERPSAF